MSTEHASEEVPLPPFRGEPYVLPLEGGPDFLAERFWNQLNGENRISLAVKSIDCASGRSEIVLRNLYQRLR